MSELANLASALSAEEIVAIEHELAHVPYKHGAAIDVLKIVQDHRGWVSDESLQAIADLLDMSNEELEGVATFYNLIFRRPVGEKVILLCNSVSCWIKGCDNMQKRLSQKLGVQLGETTKDNQYTLLPVPCLGACDKAPVMMIGRETYYNLTTEKIDEIIADYKAKG